MRSANTRLWNLLQPTIDRNRDQYITTLSDNKWLLTMEPTDLFDNSLMVSNTTIDGDNVTDDEYSESFVFSSFESIGID